MYIHAYATRRAPPPGTNPNAMTVTTTNQTQHDTKATNTPTTNNTKHESHTLRTETTTRTHDSTTATRQHTKQPSTKHATTNHKVQQLTTPTTTAVRQLYDDDADAALKRRPNIKYPGLHIW